GDYWSSKQKSDYLRSFKGLTQVPWQPLIVDEDHNWLIKRLPPEFLSFMPMGMREAKISQFVEDRVIFKLYSGGVKTNRDTWVYDFNRDALVEQMKRFIDTYN